MKYIFLLLLILVQCVSTYDVVKVNKSDYEFIKNWKAHNVSIISIDTFKTYYIVKYR